MLEVDVMEQSGNKPKMRIVPEVSRVTFHGRSDHECMVALVVILHVGLEQGLGVGF